MSNKKKFSLIVFFIIISGFMLHSIDIVDCYNSMPDKFLKGVKYKLTYKNNAWTTMSSRKNGYEVDLEIDKENYYLRIYEPGAGICQTVTIYLTKNNYSIAAVDVSGYILGNFNI